MESSITMNVSENVPWSEIPPFGQIDSDLRQVNDLIHRSFEVRDSAGELTPLCDHVSTHSGKMLRPGLVLLTGRCFGPLTAEHTRVAAMVEMIHHATLLHDDVIDEGRMRRGAPTANALWGNESAVLLGDFVLSQVFRMASDLDASAAKTIATTAIRVCEGELRQAMQKRNWQLSESHYIEIITDKSAAFFSGCCRLGGLLSHAGEDQIEALSQFGLLAGIAFQITDDLLDIAGDEQRTGKATLNDFARDKLTLAVIHLLRTVDEARRADICALLESPDGSGQPLVDMLSQHGSLQYARERADDYVTKATQALECLPASKDKDALIETAHFMANRAA